MNKSVILLVLVIFAIIGLFTLGIIRLTGLFVGFRQPAEMYKWWNVSWHYRVELEINTTSYNRTDWPIEHEMNFTDLMPGGTFDENSTRVIEYNSSGSAIYEVPSQFDKNENYDASSNALGTLVFLMNGTTQPNTERIFFIYYDSTENGAKEEPNYSTGLETDLGDGWGGDEFNVNNTVLNFWIDTIRGENTSGIIRVWDVNNNQDILKWPLAGDERTYEYMQFSNGTYNFSFNLTNNATLKYNGPIRMVVEQKGDEIIWNLENTTEGFVVKRYIFYDKLQWIKVEVNFTNIESYNITRNSTFAGALGLDTTRALYGSDWQSAFGNTSEPGWWYGADNLNNFQTGIIHINQTGTNNFWVPNSSSKDRIGIQLNSTNISSVGPITETAAFRFAYQEDYHKVEDLRNRLAKPVNITQYLPERWYVVITPSTNATIYNRNESVLIVGDVSANDPYNFTEYMNATLDMGTASPADDQTIILYDDGAHDDYDVDDKVFANIFNLSNSATTGIWTINFTTYSENLDFLNSTLHTFNVTDVLNVTVNITNDRPVVGTIVFGNVYVKNYNQSTWIIGAIINCSYELDEVTNITDHSNGTYSFNFTAPGVEDLYSLVCNATKNGNFGEGNDTFITEPGVTNVSIISQPPDPSVSDVSLYNNGSFVITVNATVTKNGTAYATNMSLELLTGWDANWTTPDSKMEQCGDIEPYVSCIRGFNITVPNNTSPGNYYINVTVNWTNPDNTNSTNKTEVNVTVQSNPLVDVKEDNVTGEVADGTSIIVGNFTVLSVGNDQIENITFSCLSGDVCNNFAVDFIPDNITTLSVGSNQSVSVNVTVPLGYTPGTYSSVINVTAENNGNDTFILNTTVPAKTNVSVTPSIPNYTSHNVTQGENETFSFQVNLTDVKNGSARYTNVSLSYEPSWSSNSSFETCGNLTKDEFCTRSFNVTIPVATPPGYYYVNITANWTNTDNTLGTNTTPLLVDVRGNPQINVSETNVTGNASDGVNTTIGNFTVLSIGNDDLQNIGFNCYPGSGEVCDNLTLVFNPSSISTLAPNENETVVVNVTVPVTFPTGTYNGTLNISAENDGYKNLTIFVTVLENRTWDLTPKSCEKSTQQPEGIACEVNVTNLGNIIINFTVSPTQDNHTEVNETSFNITRANWHVFAITYNVTGEPPGVFNSTFTVDAIQSDANPDNISINVSLVPYIPPIINVSIVPNETYQNNTVKILANVTDRSGSNISWTRVNITRPDAQLDSLDMFLINESGNFTMWELAYPNSTDETNGSTYVRGLYNITVYASDNIGDTNYENSSLLIYARLDIATSTLTNIYYQGDTASIYYVVKDIDSSGVENVTVSFVVYDSQGNISYLSGNFTTNEDGTISPLPSFELSSDTPLGYYTLNSHSTYYDSVVNKTLEFEKNYTFEVLSRTVTVTGVFADIETTVVWYPDNIMKFGILVYNGEGRPVDPTTMNLTVYDPADNIYFTVSMEGVNNFTKHAIGYFSYNHAMGSGSATGMYLAVLNVTQNGFETMKLKAFRVARGGPYDVRLNLLESEVEQGDPLDYVILIENKGEVSQDVFVEYWISPIGENRTDGYWSERVLTPALTDQSFTRDVEVPSSQPLGVHLLWARVSYDSTQSPLDVNSSFTVLARVTPTTTQPPVYPPYPYIPTPAAPLPVPTVELLANLLISKYNSNISLARDVTIIESVTVNNTGQVDLNNVSLYLVGVPTTWYNITPERYRLLSVGESAVFVITFRAPKNADITTYGASFIATSGVVSDQKSIEINVFASLEDLLKEELRKLRIRLQELEVNTKVAKIEGKDTTNVEILIDEIKRQLDLAEDNIEQKNLEEASSNLANAKNLLEKAEELLEKLEIIKVKEFLPLWVIIAIIIVISVIVFVIIYLKRKKVRKILRPWIIPFGRLAEGVKRKKVTKEEIARERDRIERMLRVLEKEKNEGIISPGAYREMKKSLEKKLEKIKKKLK